MDAVDAQRVPCLALLLGDAATLAALHNSFNTFPRGVTYPQFRHILLDHLHSPPPSTGRCSLSVAAATASLTSSPLLTPTESPQLLTFAAHDDALPAAAATSISAAPITTMLSTSHVPLPVYEGHDANREEARLRRLCTQQELAGLSAVPVDPIKQLFNRIDVGNEQRVTWGNLLDYVVAEAGAGVAEARYSANRTKIYSFCRAIRCPMKQHPKPSAHQQQQQGGGDGTAPTQRTPQEASLFKRYHPALRTTTSAKAGSKELNGSGTAAPNSNPVRVEEDLALIRLIDGLESHSSVFFVSSRSHPFLLYSKDTLERVFTAPPEMLGEAAVPTTMAYLPSSDLFLCYSTDDRLLRGWFSLLAQSIATVAATPLLVEGFVRRMQIMPTSSPSYAEYSESVFLGDSYGHVLHVRAPHGRGGGMEFALQRTYKSLHTRASGGLVDFCVYGGHLYSSGFDGRVVATSLATGQSSELGSVPHEHLHALVYVPPHAGLVAATSTTRQLLWWEAGSQSALPGVPFEHAGYGDHGAAIIAVVYVAGFDYLASADCEGVVKVWEMVTHRCVQSFQSSRMATGEAGSAGGTEATAPGTTLKSQGRARWGSVTPTNFAASAGKDMMMLTHNGLHSLLSEAAGAAHVGSAQCHSLTYCVETEELLCGFANAITCWGLHGNKNPYLCDAEEACHDVQYDVRNQTFLLRSATRLSVWDSAHGARRGFLHRTKAGSASHARADIKAFCVDDLGSRIFLATGDGSVYVYPSHALTTDAAADTDESSYLWSPAATAVIGADGKTTAAVVVVEQMYYSPSLRTWLAITTAGTLLVRTEADSRQIVASSALAVSAVALTQLRVSEELGLVAVVDAEHVVYLYDMAAWSDAPERKEMAAYGRVVDLIFLDTAPVLATVHVGGLCRLWSCPPAVECFELLGTIRHPLLPVPAVAADEATESVLRPASAAAAASVPLSTTVQLADVTSGAASRPATATAIVRGGSPRPLTATLRSRVQSSRGDTLRSRTAGSRGEEQKRGPKSATLSGYDGNIGNIGGGTAVAEGLSASGAPVLSTLPSGTMRPKAGLGGVGSPAATQRDSRVLLPDLLLMNAEARSKALASELREFTAVSYDGRSHHLFLGDAEGVLHIYAACNVLQAFRLPACSYAVRPAFTLFSSDRASGWVQAEGERPWSANKDSATRLGAAVTPVLLRSVDVHVLYRDRKMSRRRSSSAGSSAMAMGISGQAQAKGRPRRHDAGGIICVRWLASRGVLATTGNDHEVWLLSADGDKLGFLSAERLPPRPKALLSHSSLSASPSERTPAVDALGASLLSTKSATADDGPPLQCPFSLPPTHRIAKEMGPTETRFAGSPVCCTHTLPVQKAAARQPPRHNRTPRSRDIRGGAAEERSTDTRGSCSSDRGASFSFPRSAAGGPSADASHAAPATHTLAEYLAAANSTASPEKRLDELAALRGLIDASLSTTSMTYSLSNAAGTVGYASAAATSAGVFGATAANTQLHTTPPSAYMRCPMPRSPNSVRFTKTGRVVQGKAAVPAKTRGNADTVRAAHTTASPTPAAACDPEHASTDVSVNHSNGAQEGAAAAAVAAAVDTSYLELAAQGEVMTLPNVTPPVSSEHPALQQRLPGSFLRSVAANPPTPVVAALAPEMEESQRETSLWITGLQLSSSGGRFLPDSTTFASLPRPQSGVRELSASAGPRRGRLAHFAPLRPNTSGCTTGPRGGRLGASDPPELFLGSSMCGGRVPPPPRAATATATPPLTKTSASRSPMLAYSSAGEGDSTLDLYSRELRQRLRRPRFSNT